MAVKYTDNSVKWFDNEVKGFDTFNRNWQYGSYAIPVKNGDKVPLEMTVYCCYYNNENIAYFDNIQVVKDSTQSYTYDAKGNCTGVKTLADQKTSLVINDNNEAVKSVDSTGSRYYSNYTSSYKHRATSTYASGVTTKYSNFDSKGNITNTKITSSEIKSGNSYYIRTAFQDYAMNVAGNGSADGTQIQQYKYDGGTGQKMLLKTQGTVLYVL